MCLEANSMERVLLIFIVFITAISISEAIDDTSIAMIASVLIIFPFALLIYYIWNMYKSQFIVNDQGQDEDIGFEYIAMTDDEEDTEDKIKENEIQMTDSEASKMYLT